MSLKEHLERWGKLHPSERDYLYEEARPEIPGEPDGGEQLEPMDEDPYKDVKSMNKPGGCHFRRTPPRGPVTVCRGICDKFEPCVELTREELKQADWVEGEIERMDKLFDGKRES